VSRTILHPSTVSFTAPSCHRHSFPSSSSAPCNNHCHFARFWQIVWSLLLMNSSDLLTDSDKGIRKNKIPKLPRYSTRQRTKDIYMVKRHIYIDIYIVTLLPLYNHTPMGWFRLVGSIKLWVSFAKEPYKRDSARQRTKDTATLLPLYNHTPTTLQTHSYHSTITLLSLYCHTPMGRLRFVGSIILQVPFAKEPYKRDCILQNRPMIRSILLTIATPYHSTVTLLWGGYD